MKVLAPLLDGISDDVLLARVADLVGRGRRVEADLVRHLAEVDRRRLYLREACPSMHVYATVRLHLSDAEAYLRITAARLSRRFPTVLDMLADGRVHLSSIAKLAPHLRDDNAEALLARAAHRSKREIELLVAELAPRPDVPSRMRRLRTPPAARAIVGAVPLVPAGVSDRAAADGASPAAGRAVPSTSQAAPLVASPEAPMAVTRVPPPLVAAVKPIAPSRYKVQFTASAALHDKITRARSLLRHQIPDGDLGVVFDRAMTLLVRELERARFAATKTPRKAAHEVDPTPSSRRIPDPIKREVWTRDAEQCTYSDRTGRRCPARELLEFHHLVPFGKGGDHSPSNLTLRCAAHNALQADLDFGAAFMAGKRQGSHAHERRARFGIGRWPRASATAVTCMEVGTWAWPRPATDSPRRRRVAATSTPHPLSPLAAAPRSVVTVGHGPGTPPAGARASRTPAPAARPARAGGWTASGRDVNGYRSPSVKLRAGVRLRVITWNVHKCIGGLDRRYDPERVRATIAHYEPDLVLLQEVDHLAPRSKRDRQVDLLGDLLGLRHRTWYPNVQVRGGGEYGNAILSRYPLTESCNIDLTVPPKKRRSVLHARYRVRLGSNDGRRHTRTVHVYNMHLGLSGVERKMQLRRFLASHPFVGLDHRTPIVVAGDFNDVWGTLGRKLLEPAGFRGFAPMRTFPAYAPMRALDAIYVRGNVAISHAQASRMELARRASDHLPLIADLMVT